MISRRKASVIIYQGDDLEHMAELRQKANMARRLFDEWQAGARNRGSAPELPADAENRFDAFVDEAAERATTVWLTAIGRKRFRELKAAHKPRRELRMIQGQQTDVVIEEDADEGVDTTTFPDALLAFHDPATGDRTITEPEFPTPGALADFLDDLADGDYEKLWTTAFYLNAASGADPQFSRYSASRPNSDATSE